MAQQDSERPEPAQRITHRQAAELLSSHVSFISKLLARGELHTTGLRGPGVGTLDLDEVLKVREARLQAERKRRLRYDRVDPPRKGPPVGLKTSASAPDAPGPAVCCGRRHADTDPAG